MIVVAIVTGSFSFALGVAVGVRLTAQNRKEAPFEIGQIIELMGLLNDLTRPLNKKKRK